MEAAKPTENKTDAMNDSIIAFKAHKQLKRFLGRFSPHFHKPTVQFIGQALYGIQASGDVKLASWVRMLDEGISAKKVEDRLSRNLSLEGMDRKIQQIVMDDSRGFVKKDTLIVIDPTDICKENARKMQYLYKVRDGSRSKENGDPLLVNGYTGCMAIACNSGNRRIVPLHFSLWSTIAPDYHSENTELGHNMKAEILVEHLTRMSRQICETPDFHYYALAAGLKMAFMRHGRWSRVTDDWKSPQLELKLDWG